MILLLLAQADWPHWRGPTRNDVVAVESGWTGGDWPAGSPLWRASVGEGCTSPLVYAGRLYVSGWSDGRDTLRCLDAATGKELWKSRVAAPRYGRHAVGDQDQYGGITTTPALDPATGWLYSLGNDGDLHAWDTAKPERPVWSLNLYERYAAPVRPKIGRSPVRDYGYTCSPLLSGDRLLVEVGGASGTVVAFDKRTGKERWRSAHAGPAGHTGGIVPMTVEGVDAAAVLATRELLVVRLDAGREGATIGTFPWETEFANNNMTPAVEGPFVVISSGYNRQAIAKLKVTLGGIQKVWEQSIYTKTCSPVIHKGRVYWAWHGLNCLDFETGRVVWSGGTFGDVGSIVATADDRLIVWANNGDLALVEGAGRSPDKLTVLAQKNGIFSAAAWPHVVVAAGRIFAKDRAGNLACFSLKR